MSTTLNGERHVTLRICMQSMVETYINGRMFYSTFCFAGSGIQIVFIAKTIELQKARNIET